MSPAIPWGLRRALRQLLHHQRCVPGLQRRLRYLLARGLVEWQQSGGARALVLTQAGKVAASGRAC